MSIVNMLLDRVSFLHEMLNESYLFDAPNEFDAKTIKKKWKEQTPSIIVELRDELSQIDAWEAEVIETNFKLFLERKELGFGAVLPGFRLMLSGKGGGPSIYEIAVFLGKEETLNRIDSGLEIAKTWA